MPNSSDIYMSIATDKLLQGTDVTNAVLLCELRDGKDIISENTYYFAEPKNLRLEKTDIKKEIERTDNGYVITLRSKNLAKNVRIDIDGENAAFSDNYFDLLPGRSKKVTINTGNDIENIDTRIKTFSLIDSYMQ